MTECVGYKYTFLDINKKKKKNKISVVDKLKRLGYDVSEKTSNREINDIIRKIQSENHICADALIGIRTMPLLGYHRAEINELLVAPKKVKLFGIIDTWVW